MYKKITHTIIEEHFDNPSAVGIKKSLKRSKMITNEVFSEPKFKEDVHTYITKYRDGLTSLVTASTGTDEDLMKAFDNFFKTTWVDDLGNMTKPLYVTEFSERLNEGFRIMVTGLFLAIQSMRMGKDSGLLFGRMQFASNEIAQDLNNFNTYWQYPIINTLFNNLLTDLMNRVKARIAKNATLEQQLELKNAESWAEFEKQFVTGILTQHPERFTQPVINALANDSDIM